METLHKMVENHFLCPICKSPFIGLVEVDTWGNRYCTRHSKEFPRCTCCQRLICEAITSGGVAYRDKRLVCNICRKSAVDTKEQAKPYVNAVAAWLFKQGLVFRNLTLKFDLVYLDQMPSQANHGDGVLQGIIYQVISGRPPVRKVNGVAILKGLSRQVMSGVVAHELGHAWLFLSGIDRLALPIVEGFCNTLSYLYHCEFNTEEAEFCKKIIEMSPDRIYGDGFRKVYSSVKKNGFPKVLSHLHKYQLLL